MVDQYVIVRDYEGMSASLNSPSSQPKIPCANTAPAVQCNPHSIRVTIEHSYCRTPTLLGDTITSKMLPII